MKRAIMEPVIKEVAQLSQGEDKQEPVVFLPPALKVGRRPPKVTLSEHERSELEALTRKTTAHIAHVQRAKIALLCCDGLGTDEISTMVGVSAKTVSKWRKRFSLFGVAVLDDAPRSGTPRTHNDEKLVKVRHTKPIRYLTE